MRIRLAQTEALGEAAADEVVAALQLGLITRGSATLAISGGRTPAPLFAALARRPLPWDRIDVFQVDERWAPDGHPDRNLTAQRALLPGARLHAMPIAGAPAEAAARYAATLHSVAGDPPVLDCVHLGLGDDGHTASLVPGDSALEEVHAPVAVTSVYQGRVRLTLTRPVLDAARQIVWLVSGAGKRSMVDRMLAGDASIPAGRIHAPAVLVLDPEADPTGVAR